jgi:hypothetical protein
MMYYCQGINKVVGVHFDEQAIPLSRYGAGTFMIWVKNAPMPVADENYQFAFPTITPTVRSDSTKWEAGRRIEEKVSPESQSNMQAYNAGLAQKQINGQTLTPGELQDQSYFYAIFNWIGRPNGMLAASDAMIASGENQWWLDVKWPPWNTAWNVYVARF